MSTYTKDGISFNITENLDDMQFSKLSSIYSKISRGVIEKISNAVEIDWNNAVLPNADSSTGGSKTINDTSELLSLINTMQKEIYVLTAAVIALAQR